MKFFRVIYYDDDKKTLGVSMDPISDDTAINNRTRDFQSSGQNIRISTTEPVSNYSDVPSIDEIIENMPIGYNYDSSLSW